MMGLIAGAPTKRDAELAAEATRESWQALLDRLGMLTQAKSLPERQSIRNDVLGAIHVHMARRSYENRINWQIEHGSTAPKPEAPSAPIPPLSPKPAPEPSPKAQAIAMAAEHNAQHEAKRAQERASKPAPEPFPEGVRMAKCDYNNGRKLDKPWRNHGPIYGGGEERGMCDNLKGGGCRCRCMVPSDPKLPFFKAQPEKGTDSFFCGCAGWE